MKIGTRVMSPLGGLAVLLLFSGSPASAAETHASGRFASQGVGFDVQDAFAFHGKVGMGEGIGIVVAVTDGTFNAEVIRELYDRRGYFEGLFKEHPGAFFEFDGRGRYMGLSYYIQPGNGCGFCKDGVDSTVKLQDGKLAGALNWKDKDRSFQIKLDVAIASDDLGAKLPPGGGAAGNAYRAYHDALAKQDVAALKKLMAQSRMAMWQKVEKQDDVQGYLAYLAKDHPTTFTVTDGFEKSDRGLILVTGENRQGKMSAEVLMRKEDGAWRVYREMIRQTLE
jgi:hypothetical protein